ncbi:hypothetical protein WMY93_015100 [Mugilogobius chulae]|uniref:C-type lectin domain-containing protein n=1 Tax=Mugilogobius chulae TaxID=88201 RepID=A0AAW0P0T7_9GOBI
MLLCTPRLTHKTAVDGAARHTYKLKMEQTLWLSLLLSQMCFSVSQDHVYHFINEEKSWVEAQTFCRKYYTDLATVNHMRDLERLRAAADGQTDVWIGLHQTSDKLADRKWHWSQPEVKFDEAKAKWEPGEPNDAKGTKVENCGQIYTNNHWNDASCEMIICFICNDQSSGTIVMIDDTKSWLKAQQFCRTHHTDLMSGPDQQRQFEAKYPSRSDKCWMGLFRDNWGWSDGSDSSFRNWKTVVNSLSKKCAALVDQDRWESEDCGLKKPFICHGEKVVFGIHQARLTQVFSWLCKLLTQVFSWLCKLQTLIAFLLLPDVDFSVMRIEKLGSSSSSTEEQPFAAQEQPRQFTSRDEEVENINEEDFNSLHNTTVEWGDETWTPEMQTQIESSSEEYETKEYDTYSDDSEDQDYIPPVCLQAGGALKTQFRLENLPQIHMDETVHDDPDDCEVLHDTTPPDTAQAHILRLSASLKMDQTLWLSLLLSQMCFSVSQDHVYHFINEEKSWAEAQTFCRKYYTDLATVNHMRDLERLRAAAGGQTDVWIGLHQTSDKLADRKWHWSQPDVKYNEGDIQWYPGQPDDFKDYGGIPENCGIFYSNNQWHDGNCNLRYSYFICYTSKDEVIAFCQILEVGHVIRHDS